MLASIFNRHGLDIYGPLVDITGPLIDQHLLMTDWASTLSNYRSRLNLTQAAVAAMANVTVKTISRWENGEREPDKAIQAQVLRKMLSGDLTVFRARVEASPLYEIVRTAGGQNSVIIGVSRTYCSFHGLPDQTFIRDRQVDETIAMSSHPDRFSDFRDRLLTTRNAIINENVSDIAFVTGTHHVTNAAGELLLASWIAVPTVLGSTTVMHNTMTWAPCPDPMPEDKIHITWIKDL